MIFAAISNFLGALKEGLGFARQRDAEKNAPAMQANARAQTDAKISADIAAADTAAQGGDLEADRKLGAE